MKRYVKLFESWTEEENKKETSELAMEIAAENGVDPSAVRLALKDLNVDVEEFGPEPEPIPRAEFETYEEEEDLSLGLGPISMMAGGLVISVLAVSVGKFIDEWQTSRDNDRYAAERWLRRKITTMLKEGSELDRNIEDDELAKATADALLNDKEIAAEFKARLKGRHNDREARSIFER
jgi:hypothetical protein